MINSQSESLLIKANNKQTLSLISVIIDKTSEKMVLELFDTKRIFHQLASRQILETLLIATLLIVGLNLISPLAAATNSRHNTPLRIGSSSINNGISGSGSLATNSDGKPDVQIECNSDSIVVTLSAAVSGFNGMIYPKGLSKNSSCMVEYEFGKVRVGGTGLDAEAPSASGIEARSARINTSSSMASNKSSITTGDNQQPLVYILPLRACNTMSTEVEDGIEYFNTVMVQPHKRLVTNQGRGYHVRCKYQTRERTITNLNQQLSVNLSSHTPAISGSAALPKCTMRIYSLESSAQSSNEAGNSKPTNGNNVESNELVNSQSSTGASDGKVLREVSAEHVKIGDELQLVISLEDQDVYGMLVTDCLVRDGLNWGEQQLIDQFGCPVDEDIMRQFDYSANKTRASVSFQAHKFPYTASVYYQCNVKLCFKDQNCDTQVPPNCNTSQQQQQQQQPSIISTDSRQRRHKRQTGASGLSLQLTSALQVADGSLLEDADNSSFEDDVVGVAKAANQEALPSPAALQRPSDDSREEQPDSRELEEQLDPRQNKNKSKKSKSDEEREFCMTLRKFAIAISLISLLLMLIMLSCLACTLNRRKKLAKQQQQRLDHENVNYEHDDDDYEDHNNFNQHFYNQNKQLNLQQSTKQYSNRAYNP